jgi:hypothetical protein
MSEQRMSSLEKKVDKIEDSMQAMSGDMREMLTTMKTTMAPMIEKLSDVEQRLRVIELERAKESTAREWLSKNWLAIVVFMAVFANESAIISKLL